MQTYSSSHDPEYLPIPCTIVVQHEDLLGPGTIWGFYPHRCHVESDLPVSPGMTVSLSLHVPGAAGIRLEQGLVTWSRPSEFGVRFAPRAASISDGKNTPSQAPSLVCAGLRGYLRRRVAHGSCPPLQHGSLSRKKRPSIIQNAWS